MPVYRPGITESAITAAGSILVLGSLLWYQMNIGGSGLVSTGDIGVLEEAAYVALTMVFVGLALAFVGITRLLQTMSSRDHGSDWSSIITGLSAAVADRRSAAIFAIGAVSYGLIFGVASSTLLYQPGTIVSEAYGIRVPSFLPVLCCGSLGQMPQLVLYLTQNFAILIIPVNLILLFVVSWLVGLNVAVATRAYAIRPEKLRASWVAGFGAIVGLFTACPTCAGFLFLTIVGLSGATGLALALSARQAIFVAVGIPVLIATPVLVLRRMPDLSACTLRK